MTSDQLRSIFHVESQDLVPHYEVVHLIHHGTTEHRISKRSITSSSSSLSRSNNQFDDKTAKNKLSSHHVKKDLSKSAYYSELKKESTLPVLSKWSAPTQFTNSIHSELNPSNSNSYSSDKQSKLVKNSSSDNEFDIQQNENDDNNNSNEYKQQFTLPSELVRDENSKIGDSDSYDQIKPNRFDLANIKEHNVSLNVFGQMFNLTLRPTTQLFKNGTQSLPMFTVNVTPNATHGLSYEPIEEVIISSLCFFSLSLSFHLVFFRSFKTLKSKFSNLFPFVSIDFVIMFFFCISCIGLDFFFRWN